MRSHAPIVSGFPRLAVRWIEQKGRGVFAEEDIADGTVLESCPVLVIPSEEMSHVMATMLQNYVFQWGGTREDGAVALGFGSLYNHSHEPNAMYVRKEVTLDFVALRDIRAGEEITVSYHGGFGDRSPVWFEVR